MAIEVYLQRNNFRVTIAEGGEAGLRALEHQQFDLMIIDIFMPHMRGFESIRLFHERAPVIPLIAMSGYAFANLNSPAPDFLRMALELGAARCLRKPFTPHALLAAINALPGGAPSRRRHRLGRAIGLARRGRLWPRGNGSFTASADHADRAANAN
ncbi:response regulator [Bradyrhizobium ottawaense]